ncbi:MAG: carbohydrate-binding domain-containing protein [Eubacteriales bacterium]|nr:carbohydrate-binding domain-containing protein [Eubacteriales bacterium]
MKQFRKHRLALLLIPVLLICASAFGLGAYTVSKEPSTLKKAALFAEAERDLDALADLSGAKLITVRDGQDVDIGEAGIWIIDGDASDVTVNVEAPGDAVVYLLLKGLRIENRDRPCIYVGSAGKVYLVATGDSRLAVSKAFRKDPGRKANAVVYSRTELTLHGEAPLTVDSPKNGIVCRDKLRFLGGEYTITAGSKAVAADNAIWIAGGDFRLKAKTDGLHAENEDDGMQGSIYIGGGSFDIDVADDGIHGQTMVQIDDGRLAITADEGIESTWVLINGGEMDIHASGDGINAGRKSDAYRPRIEINGGSVTVVMDGEDPDAIDSNADLIITGGTVNVSGAGIDWDGKLEFTGGTVIIEGEAVSEIPNTSTHRLDE